MFHEEFLHADRFSERGKSLGPAVVFFATAFLTLISVVAIVVSFSLCAIKEASSFVVTSMSLTLISAAISFTFLGIYLLAARRNEPVSKSRPPISPIHCASFVTMRLGFLLWAAAAIATLVTTAGLPSCLMLADLCRLQRIQIIVCVLASLTAATLVYMIENCDEPFRAPSFLHITPKVACRVSYFDDFFEQTLSRRSSVDRGDIVQQEGILRPHLDEKQTKRKPVPLTPRCSTDELSSSSTLVGSPSQSQKLTKDFTTTSLVKECIEVKHRDLVKPGPRIARQKIEGRPALTDYYLSKLARSSPNDAFSSGLQDMASGHGRARRAPSSSRCSSSSQRSPLSTMRTIENPDLAIQPDLRFYPLANSRLAARSVPRPLRVIAVPHLPLAHTKSAARSPLPNSQRQAQRTHIREHPTGSPSEFHCETRLNMQGAGYLTSNALNECHDVGSGGELLEAHTRLIEESIVATVQRRRVKESKLKERRSIGEMDHSEDLSAGAAVAESATENTEIGRRGNSLALGEVTLRLPELDLGSYRLWEV